MLVKNDEQPRHEPQRRPPLLLRDSRPAVQTNVRALQDAVLRHGPAHVRAKHLDAEDVVLAAVRRGGALGDDVSRADGGAGPAERGRRRRRPDRRPALRGRPAHGLPQDVANDRAAFAFSINFVGALVAVGATLCVQFLSGFDYGVCLYVWNSRAKPPPDKSSPSGQAFRAAGRPKESTQGCPGARTRRIRDEQRLPNRKTSAQPTEKPQLLPQHKNKHNQCSSS